MGSRVSKVKKKANDITFADGYKYLELKNRKKPHHYRLSKKLSLFDNDEVFLLDSDDGEYLSSEVGINKKMLKINDNDCFDEHKDGC